MVLRCRIAVQTVSLWNILEGIYSWQLKPLCEAELVSNSIEYLCYYSNKAEQVGQDLVAQAELDKYKPKPYKHIVPSYRGHLTKFFDSYNFEPGWRFYTQFSGCEVSVRLSMGEQRKYISRHLTYIFPLIFSLSKTIFIQCL